MIERKIAKLFLKKWVAVVREDDGRDICSNGVIIEVSKNSILLKFHGSVQAISLDSIKNIRETYGREYGR